MFIIEALHNTKKKIIKFWRDYFTVEGEYTSLLPDKIYLKKLYKKRLGKKLDIKVPKTFSEKLNWLKLYDRKPIYTTMVDKYAAREYVAEKIGDEYLVPLMGVWDTVDEIDFSQLPEKCVLKCNHDNGVIVVKSRQNDKQIEKIKKELSFHLGRDYYKKCREWPYKNIKRKIICEKFMENTNGDDLVDYKIFCFNGEPKLIMVNSGRFTLDGVKTDIYDVDWNHLDMQDGHYPMAGDIFKKPKCFDEMLGLAVKLSKNIPTIRVDFNYWDEKLYFGELTFFHMAALDHFQPAKWDEIIGGWLNLPINNNF